MQVDEEDDVFRTVMTPFNPDVMLSTAAPRGRDLVQHGPNRLRLQWTARDGRLMSRWVREPRDIAEEGSRITDRPAA
jgi:hypothetical protein